MRSFDSPRPQDAAIFYAYIARSAIALYADAKFPPMFGLKLSPLAIMNGCTFVLALFLQPGHNLPALADRFSAPAYAQRGDQFERLFDAYTTRLNGYGRRLIGVLQDKAPELTSQLRIPNLIRSGYQVLPRIAPDPLFKDETPPEVMAYSWPWTKRLIDLELEAIDRAMAELRKLEHLHPHAREAATGRLVQSYQERLERHDNLDAHIRYNRFWQAAIAADRVRYDRETAHGTNTRAQDRWKRRIRALLK